MRDDDSDADDATADPLVQRFKINGQASLSFGRGSCDEVELNLELHVMLPHASIIQERLGSAAAAIKSVKGTWTKAAAARWAHRGLPCWR